MPGTCIVLPVAWHYHINALKFLISIKLEVNLGDSVGCSILHVMESRSVLNKCNSEIALFFSFFFSVFSKIKIRPEMSSHRFTVCPKIIPKLTHLYAQGKWGWGRGETHRKSEA